MNASDRFLEKILFNYLKREHHDLDTSDLKLQLQSNPDYPSVKSITDTLDYFNVDNLAANVPKDALDQLPEFFLAIINRDNKTTIAQVEKKREKIKFLDSNGKNDTLEIEAFKELWNGTIIAIEKNSETVNSSPSPLLKNPVLPFALIAVFALISSLVDFEVTHFLYIISSIVGLCLSYYIIREDIGLYNQATSKICNSTENNTSCSEVIHTNSSKLFNSIALSDASITYFVSILILLTIAGYNASFFLVISAVSIPIILFTIYQQSVVIKKWCPLCLGVATLLVAQAVFSLVSFNAWSIEVSYYIKSIFIFGFIYVSWLQLKSLFKEYLRFSEVETNFFKFKRNTILFNTLLKQDPIDEPIVIDKNTSIVFGNPDAALTIHTITNPLCGHCTKAFKSYHNLLKKHPDQINLNVIFNVPSSNLEQPSSQISQRIIELYQDNKEEAFKALTLWFKIRDVTLWLKQFGKPNDSTLLTTLQAHTTICNNNNFSYTPATIISNCKFPKAYNIEDISFFIDNLTETKFHKKEPSVT